MPDINVSAPSSPFSSLLWGLDYVPVISSGKAVVDFFAMRHWNPGKLDESSTFAKAYFDHLTEKEDSRYIAVIPAFGNAIVLIQDCYHAIIKQQEVMVLKNAEQGDADAIERLYRGTPEQKAKAFECCYKAALDTSYKGRSARRVLVKIACGKEGEEKKNVLAWMLKNIKVFDSFYYEEVYNKPNLPQELRAKIVDVEIAELLASNSSSSKYSLHNFLGKISAEDRARAMGILTRSAETGSKNAFAFIKLDLTLGRSSSTPLLFQWVAKQAETLSSPINLTAWEYLKGEYYTSRRDAVVASFFKMLQISGLPSDRFSHIVDRLDTQAWIGNPAEKAQVLAGYLRVAESGNAEIMYKVGKLYSKAGQQTSAMRWLDKAAHANHLSSILAVARICAKREDLSGAVFWFEKAKGRPLTGEQSLDYMHVEMYINRATRPKPSAGFDYSSWDNFSGWSDFFGSARTEDTQGARQKAQQERARAERTRAEEKEAEAAAIKAQLTPIVGEFSTAAELQQKWRRWGLKGHPDKGGNEEEFKRVTNLFAAYKDLKGWP